MRSIVACLLCASLLGGCGLERPSVAEAERAMQPQYAVHEWGLVDVAPDGSSEIAAGPGRPRPATSDHAPRRKPVLYVHVVTGTPTFSVEVSLDHGRVVEHWPSATATATGIRWDRVVAERTPCPGLVPGTASRDARREVEACGTPDGICEVRELRSYETSDAACLSVGGARGSMLFYRGDGPRPPLPLAVARQADGSVQVTRTAAFTGDVVRITRSGGATRIGRVTLSGDSASLAVPAMAVDATAERARLVREAMALGLTASEADAFARAWSDELFGPTGGAVARDALIYWLPPSAVDATARLRFAPPPTEVRRAMMVRVDLGG